MGVSRSPLQLSGKMFSMAGLAAETPAKATRVAGESAAGIIRSVSPARLRNVGKKGSRLGVRVKVMGAGSQVLGSVKATGPWQIIEYDTRPHPIPRMRGGRANRKTGLTRSFGPAFGGQKSVALPNGVVRRTVFHPGTKGQYPFHKGAALARPVIPRVYQVAIHAEMASIF